MKNTAAALAYVQAADKCDDELIKIRLLSVAKMHLSESELEQRIRELSVLINESI